MKRQLIYHTQISLGSDQTSGNHATVTTLKSKTANAEIKSISKDGLSLCCDMATLSTILPPGQSVSPKQPAKLLVSFPLDAMVSCQCHVVYTRRLARDSFLLELLFHGLEQTTHQKIVDFVDGKLKGKKEDVSIDRASENDHKPNHTIEDSHRNLSKVA